MANLAIKGHETRGKEVIELLKMLGGKTVSFGGMGGCNIKNLYFIDEGYINFGTNESEKIIFTLEEFEEQFPYNVGNKVETIYGKIGIVKQLVWSNKDNAVRYELEDDVDSLYFANELQPYKEETITIDDFKANTKEWLIDKLESMSKDNALQTISNLYDELHKPKYPKTFIEVLDFWHPDRQLEDDYQRCYKKDLMENFQDLLYARDAYWKIAGEELNLGKPWNPDYANLDTEQWYYTIITQYGDIIRTTEYTNDVILTFPTMEMRDAFYENFKDLIEKCKELL